LHAASIQGREALFALGEKGRGGGEREGRGERGERRGERGEGREERGGIGRKEEGRREVCHPLVLRSREWW